MNSEPECVWYSPERDEFHIASRSSGFVFKDENGEFHLIRCECCEPFDFKPYFLIGEL